MVYLHSNTSLRENAFTAQNAEFKAEFREPAAELGLCRLPQPAAAAWSCSWSCSVHSGHSTGPATGKQGHGRSVRKEKQNMNGTYPREFLFKPTLLPILSALVSSLFIHPCIL